MSDQKKQNPEINRRREAGSYFRTQIKSIKTRKGIPTVLLIDGKRYIMDPEAARNVFS